MQTEDGKLDMFGAVDRTSKFAYAELHPRATRTIAKDFLDNLIKAVPYNIHTVLTDNGIQFPKREGTEACWTIPFEAAQIPHAISFSFFATRGAK